MCSRDAKSDLQGNGFCVKRKSTNLKIKFKEVSFLPTQVSLHINCSACKYLFAKRKSTLSNMMSLASSNLISI
jgi:hypothetical protein